MSLAQKGYLFVPNPCCMAKGEAELSKAPSVSRKASFSMVKFMISEGDHD